ncbi:MAG: alanyl-tRNA editing protein [Noviherbaspirillum sp.]
MQFLNRRTTLLYYEDMFLNRASAHVVEIGEDYIELDRTVAYPEGGGQEADTGMIIRNNGQSIRFTGAKKLLGRMIFLDEFPNIQVEGVIRHLVHPEDAFLLSACRVGEKVDVAIDIERRARLSLSHTASHLLYIGINQVRPDAIAGIFGCHIKIDSARFDCRVKERITALELQQIAEISSQLASRNSGIEMSSHHLEQEARYWKCEGHVIACGGTHLEHTGAVGPISIRRKCLGTGKERISCEFPSASIALEKYHA